MDCMAWKIPEGCYAAVEDKTCPFPAWWWVAAAVAAGALLLGGKQKKTRKARKR